MDSQQFWLGPARVTHSKPVQISSLFLKFLFLQVNNFPHESDHFPAHDWENSINHVDR